MIPFGLTGGLNTAGLSVGGLNPTFTQVVTLGELAKVKVFALGDGNVVTFAPQERVFAPDASVFAPDDPVGRAGPRTAATGLDPQADPPRGFKDKESGSEERDPA